jgi:DNA-binding NarL/FixJ family response regulator
MSALSTHPKRKPGPSRDAPDHSPRLRVAIIDDHPPIRTLIRVVLDASGTATVVAEADGTRQTVRAACRQQPQVVLLDQHLGPRLRGTDLIGDILRSCPSAMIAIFTGLDPAAEEEPALRAGAFAFYEKLIVTTALPTILTQDYALFRQALAGEDVCAPTAADRRRCTETSHPEQRPTPPPSASEARPQPVDLDLSNEVLT